MSLGTLGRAARLLPDPSQVSSGDGDPESLNAGRQSTVSSNQDLCSALESRDAAYVEASRDIMTLSRVLWKVFYFLAVPALLSTLVLYNYPLVFGCGFNRLPTAAVPYPCNMASHDLPFRLLALADPQLEGDTSLPDPNAPLLPALRKLWRQDYSDFTKGFPTERPTVTGALIELFTEDLPRLFQHYRKRLDLLGNDYYLAHIYRTLVRDLDPTHVVVLGDLIGSQWINDDEFERRSWRYWQRVFKDGHKVKGEFTTGGRVFSMTDDKTWERRIINVAGNHDIGYSSDITRDRIDRFERAYGKVNWDVTFTYPNAHGANSANGTLPSLRLVILNDMNLDGPALDASIQSEAYDFLTKLVDDDVGDTTSATILLTHIPLHKDDGVCVDGQLFEYGRTGLREQNHLSTSSSAAILEGLFGLCRGDGKRAAARGQNGVILNGHDHEGCDVYHSLSRYIDPETPRPAKDDNPTEWTARRYSEAAHLIEDESMPGIREITVRSMMGSYGGNAGLLTGWYDAVGKWQFSYDTCALGVQHWWWAVHVLDLVTWIVLGAALLTSLFGRAKGSAEQIQAPKASPGATQREAVDDNDPTTEKSYPDDTGVATGHEAAARTTRSRAKKT